MILYCLGYDDFLQLCVLAVALTAAAAALNLAGGSGLLGYLFAGLALGPQVYNPYRSQ